MSAVLQTPPFEFEPGVFYDMPADVYHGIEAMSASGAKEIRRSAMHYKYWRENPREPTPAMLIGTAIHAAILEPERFSRDVAIAPAVSKSTKEGKAAWAEFLSQAAGKLILSQEQHDTALRCRDAVHSHPGAQRLLDDVQTEVSIFWNMQVSMGQKTIEIPNKARIDALRNRDRGMIDVKSTIDARAEEFGRAIANYEYHAQARHYSIGGEHIFNRTPPFFAFIAVEKEPPHGVACYVLESNALLAGDNLMERAYRRYAEARRTGRWGGYTDLIESVALPQYALRVPA